MKLQGIISSIPGFKPTIDGVLKTFNKTIDGLDKIAADRDAECENIRSQIARLESTRDIATIERERANRIAAKLRDLVRGL